jgi:hypothetical protein
LLVSSGSACGNGDSNGLLIKNRISLFWRCRDQSCIASLRRIMNLDSLPVSRIIRMFSLCLSFQAIASST